MKKIFVAQDPMEAHFVRGLLEEAGFRAVILGESLATARGELPLTMETQPSVHVDDANVERAAQIVAEYEQRGRARSDGALPRRAWRCPGCGENVEDQFAQCWKCQTQRPAVGGTAD